MAAFSPSGSDGAGSEDYELIPQLTPMQPALKAISARADLATNSVDSHLPPVATPSPSKGAAEEVDVNSGAGLAEDPSLEKAFAALSGLAGSDNESDSEGGHNLLLEVSGYVPPSSFVKLACDDARYADVR